MANRKSASKQTVEGGASRSPKPANNSNPGKTSSKPPTSSNQPSSSKSQNRTAPKPGPPQPHVAANRSSNGTKSQGTSNGAPKSQGANGLTRIFGGAEATSVQKARSQDQPMHQAAPKRGNGPNNNPQKAQGHVPVPRPNVSLKPKHVQPVASNYSPGPNLVPHRQTQKAQNQAPTVQKNATNGSPKIQTSTQRHVISASAHHSAFKLGESAKGFNTPSHNHKASSHPHSAPETSNKGHKNNPPKSTISPGQTKNVPSPPPVKPSPPISSAGSKGTGNRSSDSMNPSGSKRNFSNHANVSAKQSPAIQSSGLSGWLSSWLPSAELAPVQATTKPTPNPSKAKGPLNGSQTHRIQVPNSSTSAAKGANSGLANVPPKKDLPANNKVHPESRHVQETFNNKGNNNNVSAKRLSLTEGRSLGWSEIFAIPPMKDSPPARKKTSPSISTETKGTGKSAADWSPKSSGWNHLSSYPSTTGGVTNQKRQSVPLAQDAFTARLSSTQLSPKSQAAKSRVSTAGAPGRSQAAAVPTLSLGGLLNQVSSFFGWTGAATPVDKPVQATVKPRQSHDAAPKPLTSAHQVSKSSKGNVNLWKSLPAPPTLSSTSSGLMHTEFSSKGVALSVGSVKNGPRVDVRDRLGKLNTSASGTGTRSNVTLAKEQTPDRHEGTSTRSEVATHRSRTSSKHQLVRGFAAKKHLKSDRTLAKVFSQAPNLRKGLLRQYSPTLIWRSSDSPKVVSAYSTLAASPLPSPPKNELQNKVARRTIALNPDLFKITTPIKVDAFAKNLKNHPNQPFVKSVVRSLTNGFWPWANTDDPTLPTTYDGSRQRQPITGKDKADFIQQQRKEEVALGRWSKPFGKKLLPGMYSSPIGAVPKSTPGKFRLIIDQSRGPHALNSTIPKYQVKVKLDNIHDLGTALLAVKKKHPKRKLTLFKSDVKSAYRQLPMHPLWQIKQVVSIDGQRHVDRCNTFGNRGGGWNWDAFASLVNWIGTEKKNIPDLLGYVDDNFGWEFEGNTKYYRPYKKHLPAKQTRLLKLWDELGIPHDEEKQLSGPCLPILGYEVNANAMTVKVPDEKKTKVVGLLRSHAHEGRSYTLKELQSIADSVNAAVCLYPRLRSGLRGLFDEMAGKERPCTKLTVTKSVARSLSKLADYLEHAQPVPIRQKK